MKCVLFVYVCVYTAAPFSELQPYLYRTTKFTAVYLLAFHLQPPAVYRVMMCSSTDGRVTLKPCARRDNGLPVSVPLEAMPCLQTFTTVILHAILQQVCVRALNHTGCGLYAYATLTCTSAAAGLETGLQR